MTSSHSALVEFLSRMLKLAISWEPAPRPVPHSNRFPVTWSSMAARSAYRTGCSLRGDRLLMPVPRWMYSVFPATRPMMTSGADMWLYSTRAWCSPNQAYFQLCLSAKIAYSASRISWRCSHWVSCAPGPGM